MPSGRPPEHEYRPRFSFIWTRRHVSMAAPFRLRSCPAFGCSDGCGAAISHLHGAHESADILFKRGSFASTVMWIEAPWVWRDSELGCDMRSPTCPIAAISVDGRSTDAKRPD